MTDQLFLSILDDFPLCIAVFDKSKKYIYVNKKYTKVTGNPKDFYIGMSVSGLRSKGLLEAGKGVVDTVIDSKQLTYATVPVILSTAINNFDFISIGLPLLDSEGEVLYVVVIQEKKEDLIMRIELSMRTTVSPFHLSTSQDLHNASDIIAESPQMKNILTLLDSVSQSDIPILLQGASGTGKEVLASYIHKNSTRKNKPFIVLNCGAISESLIESELFGYEKGSFSGALNTGKVGLFEAAHNGTLFLDEINSMPIQMQTRLLRALETKKIMRIGSTKEKSADFRLICSTNENLSNAIAEKRFRVDLFYRINAITVNIPSLSERPADIEPFILYFFNIFTKKYNVFKLISPKVIDKLVSYSWPGNVRELRNVMEKIVVTSPKDELTITDIPFSLDDPFEVFHEDLPSEDTHHRIPESIPADAPKDSLDPPKLTLPDPSDRSAVAAFMENCEKQLYEHLIKANKTANEIADILGKNRSTVYRKLNKYKLL